jgi:hypothetical protein
MKYKVLADIYKESFVEMLFETTYEASYNLLRKGTCHASILQRCIYQS